MTDIFHIATTLTAQGLRCAVAESCTGGLLGSLLTEYPGASAWFLGGVIAYDNSIKQRVLGIQNTVLQAHGAVSEAVACGMAHGVCQAMHADVAVSITGVAGPDGGSQDKPVGTVWIGVCVQGHCTAQVYHFSGNRHAIRTAAAHAALAALHTHLTNTPVQTNATSRQPSL